MITGDAPLTACHVAKELHFFNSKKDTLILRIDNEELLQWVSIDESVEIDLIAEKQKQFFQKYDLCVTGDSLNAVLDHHPKFFPTLLPHVRVFARIAPKQKVNYIVYEYNLFYC